MSVCLSVLYALWYVTQDWILSATYFFSSSFSFSFFLSVLFFLLLFLFFLFLFFSRSRSGSKMLEHTGRCLAFWELLWRSLKIASPPSLSLSLFFSGFSKIYFFLSFYLSFFYSFILSVYLTFISEARLRFLQGFLLFLIHQIGARGTSGCDPNPITIFQR